jgi:hypothetical protein
LSILASATRQGNLLVPLVNESDPLGVPPQNAAHFSRKGEQIKKGDRPPIQALDDPFKAVFLSAINYRGYEMGYPYHSAISLVREGEAGEIVGFNCFISDPLKDALERDGNRETFVSVIDPVGFWRKEPEGQGNSFYAEGNLMLREMGKFAVNLRTLGPDLLERAQDPIIDPTIREYYGKMGARTVDIAAYENSL